MCYYFAETVVQLQRQINRIETFNSGVGLEINIDKSKSKIVVFRNGGELKSPKNGYMKEKKLKLFQVINIYAFNH